MSQEKRPAPASAGQGENIFSLYGYQPQFSANTLVTDQQLKAGLSAQEKTLYKEKAENLYFAPSVQAVGQPGQTSVSVHKVLKTENSGTDSSFHSTSVLSTPLLQPHTHPVHLLQHHQDPSGQAGGLMSKQPASSAYAHGLQSTGFSGSTPNPRSVTYHGVAAHPASAPAAQRAQGSDPGHLITASRLQTEQFRPPVTSALNQAGMSAPGSVPVTGQIIIQQGSSPSLAVDMSSLASLPSISRNLIQQGLLANPIYSQGSVSSVGPRPHIQTSSLTKPSSLPSTSVQNFPQAGSVMSSSSQMQASLPGQLYLEGGKRKTDSSGNDEVALQNVSKQSRTAWDMGRSGGEVPVPPTTTRIVTHSVPHTSGNTNLGGLSGVGTGASGFMDTFHSFVQNSSHSAGSQQKSYEDHVAKYTTQGSESSAFSNREVLFQSNMSHSKAGNGSGVTKEHQLAEGQLKEPAQPPSQSFVEKMHATIFSLSEEMSSSAPGTGGQQPSLVMSGGSLASILKKVGRLDSSQDTGTDSHLQNASSSSSKAADCPPSVTSSAPTQGNRPSSGAPGTGSKESSLSPPRHSPLQDGSVKSEPTEEVSRSDSAMEEDLPQVSDGSTSSASESESETSTNKKKRTKCMGASTASKKMKIEQGKSKSTPLTSSNPCVSAKRSKSQGKNTRQTTKATGPSSPFNKPLVKVSLATLKRTGAPFLQHGPCTNLPYKVSKCSECRIAFNQGNSDMPSIFCRFYAFRRLKYHPIKGTIMKAGFSELSDADPDHIEPWLPRFPIEDPQLDRVMAKFILNKVGDKFCELVQQEKEAKGMPGAEATVVWKRAVTGVREMCDVCETTIFNMHWVCSKCGYVVCVDCYKAKVRISDGDSKDEAPSRKWQICTSSRYPHDASKLMLTQIIPSDALWELGRMIHDIRRKWSIPSTCPCGQGAADPLSPVKDDQCKSTAKKLLNGSGQDGNGGGKSKATATSLQLKKDLEAGGDSKSSSVQQDIKKEGKNGTGVKEEGGSGVGQKLGGCTSLRELLTKTAGKGRVGVAAAADKKAKARPTAGSSLNDIIQSVVEKSCRDLDAPTTTFKFLHYIPRLGQWTRELPIVAHSLTETSVLYPDVPHSWLCDGRLLRLHDPHHKGNLQIFQEQWKRGQPVMVSSVHKLVNSEQWKPEAFSKQFGDKTNDLVNCHNGDIIADHPMRDFWDGFECIENRLVDSKGRDLMLKLKDWPPGDDFAELLPSLFDDLMAALPLPEYTRRDGKLNLASRLPDFLVRPDLGPKMYNAFGSARFPREGTTNLHLDISDAVNVLVYVGVPSDKPHGKKEHEEAAVKAIDEAGCDSITKRRIREVHELPGALWQIFDAHDADKIRDFLNKVAKERGEEIEPNHDAIHDQSWYLNEELRDRLLKEYGVHGYTIVQCLGDSIFIPAGAPHQVRNLHSCIKVAEDFVSPEHLNHCFRMTQEFRQLSDTHSNHEDKLQVKNIIYHAVKDSIAVLRELEPEDEN
ncbi:hypothetical protein ACOMHN_065170 [Nucella lapillus]